MAVINTSELINRLCALEVEAMNALATPLSSTAVPRWYWQQEQLPYWRNRISNVQLITTQGDDGEEMEMYQYTLEAALMYAQVSEGYNGELDEAILQIIPQVIEYIDARELLQSNTVGFEEGMNFLQKAWFVSGVGYNFFGKSAAGGEIVGPSFQFTAIFSKSLTQRYL